MGKLRQDSGKAKGEHLFDRINGIDGGKASAVALRAMARREILKTKMNPHLTLTLSPPIGWERRGDSVFATMIVVNASTNPVAGKPWKTGSESLPIGKILTVASLASLGNHSNILE
jgi:hypothetical protein